MLFGDSRAAIDRFVDCIINKDRCKSNHTARMTTGNGQAAALQTSWYDYPRFCDIAFRSETPLGGRFCRGGVPQVLPFSGTPTSGAGLRHGRLVAELAGRGYRMTALT